jgi:glycosyltransferase involved in cell wall biosynthesis
MLNAASTISRRLTKRAEARSSGPGDQRREGHLRVGFVMEQNIGHTTWYQNLRHAVTSIGGIEARWVCTTLFDPEGLIERLPCIPGFVQGGVRAMLDVRSGLRDRPCDVLIFNTQKAAMLCQLDVVQTPTILMTDVTPLQYDRMGNLYGHSGDRRGPVRAAKHLVNVMNFRLARAVVGWSTWVRDSLVHEYRVPPARAQVIPPGVDVQFWCPPAQRQTGARVRLLFVGGSFERKGGRLLVDVFRDLRLYERAELHVVTRDPIEPVPGITVHHNLQNNSEELLDLYRQADAFVLPTLADCFSIASIEAMAMGLPVITTSMGGVPDIVEPGRTGYLIPPGDPHALAASLTSIVENAPLRRAMGMAGRARAVDRFDARRSAHALIHLAQRVHAEQRGTRGERPSQVAS